MVLEKLSRRERQIVSALYRLGEASATDVARALDDEDGYDSIRITLALLERRGLLSRRREKQRYLYSPAVATGRAGKAAVRDMLKTFFTASPSEAVLTLLDVSERRLTTEELDEIEAWISEARRRRGAGE